MTLDDVGSVVTTQCYDNNRRLIMFEVSCIKFSLEIQNSLGIIMCKFRAVLSKTEGMAASVRVFFEHLTDKWNNAGHKKTPLNITVIILQILL